MKAYDFDEPALERNGTPQRAHIDKSLERLGWLMDDLFRVPLLGRFGLDPLIGLIPGLGDTMTSLVSFYILVSAVRYRVPKITMLRMALNIGVDYLLGSVPFVGDLFDAYWKSNQMNLALLRKRATVSAEDARAGKASDWLFVGALILPLAVLAAGSFLLTIYLLSKLFTG
jgi:hypothetical protein